VIALDLNVKRFVLKTKKSKKGDSHK